MLVPTNWLNDYLSKPLDTKSIADALEAGGIEVEHISYAKKLDEQIIVAEIKKIAQHPNADKLKLVTIDAGAHRLTLVCGAPNLKVGQKVPYAQVGTKLPDGTVIKVAQIRGVESHGMLCSAKELGLNDDHAGLLELPADAEPGKPVSSYLSSSDVIDVTTQANRFDLLSMVGLAREAAAQTSRTITDPPTVGLPESTDAPGVKIEATSAVKRYMLVGLSFEAGHSSNNEAKSRLEAAGLRPISLPVDLTNYTMWETGQPLHSFDAKKVKLPIVVRFAQDGERLKTLDGVERHLTHQDLIIADASGPIALAGVMGGASTEVSDGTEEILLEAASFDAATVRKMAKRHGLRSEASARFERSLPPQLAEQGLKRAIYSYEMALESKLTTGLADVSAEDTTEVKIVAEPEHIAKVLSIPVTAKDLENQLTKLGFGVEITSSEVTVKVPWWRSDVKLAEDLAEEYVRMVGYDKVPARLPKWQPTTVTVDDYWPKLWQAKAILKGLGLFEVVTYSFISHDQIEHLGYAAKDHLKLKNPLSSEQAYLRRNLLPSLLAALMRNQGYSEQVGLYEISQVFLSTKPGQQPNEPRQLGVIQKGDGAYEQVKAVLDRLAAAFNIDLSYDPTDDGEFLTKHAANLKVAGKSIGRIGLIHPKYLHDLRSRAQVAYLELDFDALLAAARAVVYQPISRFPSLYRDLAVIVKRSVWWADVASAIRATGLARPSFLNDYYDNSLGKDHKSLAIRLEMSSLTGTLTDKEADKRLEQILELLKHHFDAKPRTT